MRVLFIDDNPDMLELIELGLGFEGIEAQTGTSAQEALALLEDTRYDAVVCDMHLHASGSGADVLRAVRRLQPDVPFIVLSGDPGAAAALGLPPENGMLKPVDTDALAERLRALTAS